VIQSTWKKARQTGCIPVIPEANMLQTVWSTIEGKIMMSLTLYDMLCKHLICAKKPACLVHKTKTSLAIDIRLPHTMHGIHIASTNAAFIKDHTLPTLLKLPAGSQYNHQFIISHSNMMFSCEIIQV